jgi:protein-S-isoprenylcysteine O-methyltransferase Ste14
MLARLFVWTGGALFVASLALCVGWYSFVLGRDLPPADWSAWTYDAGLFGIFAVHHSLLARDAVKRAVARAIPEPLVRSAYVWAASLLLALTCVLWRPVGGLVYHVLGWRAAVHAGVQLAGLFIIAQAVRRMDPLELAGIRRPAVSTLQIAGPYRWVRHPIYLGWMMMVFGAAKMTGDRLAFATISSAYLVIAVAWEERSLSRQVGEEYERYKERVKWRIVPYVF